MHIILLKYLLFFIFLFFSPESSVLTKAELKSHFLNGHVNLESHKVISPVQRILVGDVMANIEEFALYKLIRSCSITTFEPGVFSSLINLVCLDLRDNELTSLDSSVFKGLQSLKQLYICMNKLTTIHIDTIPSLHNLLLLNLNVNHLKRLESQGFKHLKNLECLYLSNNNLTFIHSNAFEGLQNLKEWDL